MPIDRRNLQRGTVVLCDARPDWLGAEKLPVDDAGRFLAVLVSGDKYNQSTSTQASMVFPLLFPVSNGAQTFPTITFCESVFDVRSDLVRRHPFQALHAPSTAGDLVVIGKEIVKKAEQKLFQRLTATPAERPYPCDGGISQGMICWVRQYPYNDDVNKVSQSPVLVLSLPAHPDGGGAALVARIRARRDPAKGYRPSSQYPFVYQGRLAHIDATDIALLDIGRLSPAGTEPFIADRLVVKICAEMLRGDIFSGAHVELCNRFGDGIKPYSPELVAAQAGGTYIPKLWQTVTP